MKPLDHETYREWLHLECDGELLALDKLLTESRIPVHRSFHDDVMSALPTAGWESSHPRSWVAAVIVAALLGITGAALLGTSAARLEPTAPFVGAIMAVVDLFRSTAVAGAGLLTASWKGLGLAFQELLAGSVWNLIAVGLLVFGLDFLLIRLLLRRNRPARESSKRAPR
jgi:hypothetical protein